MYLVIFIIFKINLLMLNLKLYRGVNMKKGQTYKDIMEKYNYNYKKLSVCFSGYRPEKFNFPLTEDNKKFKELKKNLKEVIFDLISKDKCIFYIGLAYGFDIIVGETLLECEKELDIVLEIKCVMPYRGFLDTFTEDWRERAYNLIDETNRLEIISQKYERGVFYKRNRFMVDNSKILVCYYDGKKGGTKYTLDYAKKNNLHIINLYDNTELNQLTFFNSRYL